MSILLLAGFALATTNQSGDLLANHAAKLSAAKSLSITFTVEHIPAAPVTYKLAYSKPNKMRLEYPGGLIVSDGKTVVEYTSASNEYIENEAGKDTLAKALDPDVAAWAAFFMPDQLKGVKDSKIVRKLSMKGNAVTQVDFTLNAGKSQTATFYVDDKLGIARGAAIKAVRGSMSTETVVKASDIAIDAADDSLFAFSAPAGAKKVEIAVGDLSKWYYNLEEGLKVAKATNRLVFLDFNATWCGPCQMYKREVFPTAEFKAYGKYFVFVDIDTDDQAALARQYGVSGIPDLRFLKSDGTEVHKVVGFKGMALLQDLEKAKDMR
jgi:outer membrane lipoprotein-sorting protein